MRSKSLSQVCHGAFLPTLLLLRTPPFSTYLRLYVKYISLYVISSEVERSLSSCSTQNVYSFMQVFLIEAYVSVNLMSNTEREHIIPVIQSRGSFPKIFPNAFFLIKTPLRVFFSEFSEQLICRVFVNGYFYPGKPTVQNPEAYSEPCQTSKMELFAKIVNAFQLHLRCLTEF